MVYSSKKGEKMKEPKTVKEQKTLIKACQKVIIRQQMEIQALRELLDGFNKEDKKGD